MLAVPGWPDSASEPNAVAVVSAENITARAVGALTIERHDDELADAGWFSRDEIRAAATWDSDPTQADAVTPLARLGALPGGISIARQILNAWLAE